MFAIRVFTLTFAIFATVAAALQTPAGIQFGWKYLNYTWESPQQYQDAVANGHYIPKNNFPAAISIWKNQLYMAPSRLRKGVPATLVVTPLEPVNGNRSPNVKPYPNWEMQKIGDCNAFQSVQSMEIDPYGRMWIIDDGHISILEEDRALCPPRLVVLDLENDGKILLIHVFPERVVDRITGMLMNLRMDRTDGGYAYISNSDSKKPSIVVFSLSQKTSWSISHPSMYATDPVIKVKADNETVTKALGINGIALSSASTEGNRILYYSPLSSYNLYSIPTEVLKRNPEDFASKVKLEGKGSSQCDGLMMNANDDLYFGVLSDNQVATWNTREKPFKTYQHPVYGDNVNLVWQSGFTIDDTKKLWVISNHLDEVFNDDIDINKVNFEIILLAQLKYKSYQYYKDGTAPQQPEI